MRLLLSLVLILTAAAALAGPLEFTNVSADTGMWRVPTTWGVTACDVDGDGDLDLLTANHGSENALFRNEGNLRFRGQPVIGGHPGTEALVPGDIDGDGLLDLVAAAWGGYSSVFFGDGTGLFSDVSDKVGLPVIPGGRCGGVGLGDLDADGDVDLYMPDAQAGDLIFMNDAGMFTDVTDAVGLPPAVQSESAVVAHFNGDELLDLYIPRYNNQSTVYLNLGEGAFEDLRETTDVFALPFRVGACPFDADGDGDIDLLSLGGRFNEAGSNLQLLMNMGEAEFVDVTPDEWLQGPRRYSTACTGDIDGDGDLDVLACAVDGCMLWLNDGAGGFTRQDFDADWTTLPGSGAVMADLDDDGDLDIVLRARESDALADYGEYLFRNELNDDNWLRVRPIDERGCRFAMGAQVRVYEAGGIGEDQLGDPERLIARRDIMPQQGWGSYGPFMAHFGLEAGATYDVEVRFTDTWRVTGRGIEPGQYVEFAVGGAP